MTNEAKDPAFERRFLERYEQAKTLSVSLDGHSPAERLAALPRDQIGEILGSMSRYERAQLLHCWRFWARPKQLVPDFPHFVMLWLAGRGFGKTRTAAERIRQRIYGGVKSLVLIGPTWREVLRYMVGGKRGARRNGSGLLDIFPPHERAQIELKEQKGEIHFNFCGAVAHLVSDEQPELRGGAYEVAWLDEICKWKHLKQLWENLEFTMREQTDARNEPEILVTTTPKPMQFLKELVADPDTITIVGRTDENKSALARRFVERLDRKFTGTRIGRQERDGEILGDNESAFFQKTIIEATRVLEAPPLVRVVIAIDPGISIKEGNDPTGIVAIGIDHRGHLFVLGDGTKKALPEEWGSSALKLYDQHKADAFVGERNRGGDLVASNMRAVIRDKRGAHASLKYIEVQATRNKQIRAEPVSALHEQGRLHFVGVHPEIEQEITEWDPTLGGASPNRLDALVWGAYELAKLGEDMPVDPAAAFEGIVDLGKALANPSQRTSNIATLLGGGGGGGRI